MTESVLVAMQDGRRGCPVIRWSGGLPFRCSLGVDRCSVHGYFATETTDEPVVGLVGPCGHEVDTDGVCLECDEEDT